MQARRQVVVLFDIDDTIINFNKSVRSLVYNGGKSTWITFMTTLKEAAALRGIDVHFGIATFKAPGGDGISQQLLKELGHLFDEKLLYFTNGKSKTTHALEAAEKEIQQRNFTINKRDIFIVDDILNIGQDPNVIIDALMNGFNAAHACELTKSSQATQQQRVINLFEFIYRHLGLSVAMPAPAKLVDEKKAAAEEATLVKEEAYEKEILFRMKQPLTPRPSFNFHDFMKSIPSTVKSLDEDDDVEPAKPSNEQHKSL